TPQEREEAKEVKKERASWNFASWINHVSRPPPYFLARSLFLRGMGVIYFIAFYSLYVQLPGLIGHSGLLPADAFLSRLGVLTSVSQESFLSSFRTFPSLIPWL